MLKELILKDLKVFFSDRRALIFSILVPIGIASFMAAIFGSAGNPGKDLRVPLLVVDQDQSALSRSIVSNLQASKNLDAQVVDAETAYGKVKTGKSAAALLLPKGLGEKAPGSGRPELDLVTDPAQNAEVQAVRGLIVQPVVKAMFPGFVSDKPPFDLEETSESANQQASDGGAAHVFDGMAVQGLLFFSIEAAMGVMRERKQGIWKRVRAAPVPPTTLLLARILSGTIRAFVIIVAVIGFGIVVYHFKVLGSWLGLALIGVASALMASTFGMFVAALGKTENQSRSLAIFVVLSMTMLGGAWFPSFLMPNWVQKVSLAIPVKWAVDGFDAMTWRGGDFSAVPGAVGALLVFSLVFGFIALTRFRWDAEGA